MTIFGQFFYIIYTFLFMYRLYRKMTIFGQFFYIIYTFSFV